MADQVENKLRPCDCFLKESNCYCTGKEDSIRYTVKDRVGIVQSRWGTINEALQDGRKNVGYPFTIYDSLEQRTLIQHGG